MKSNTITQLSHWFFVILFFFYLFSPLMMMGLSGFNQSAFPQVFPWEGFTFKWFATLYNDTRLINGIINSFWIACGVVLLAVPMGLAGALLLMQLGKKTRSFFFTVMISPILVPGIILGISTLIFWDGVHLVLYEDPYANSIFINGFFLTIIGQSTFISSYCMLIFVARLQRFDFTQEEAAFDLGAKGSQIFRKVLLPFLRPSCIAAVVLAFLSSFENYNTTVFTIYEKVTLTTELAGKVRLGVNPSVSALSVIIIGLTLIGAVTQEILKRRELSRSIG